MDLEDRDDTPASASDKNSSLSQEILMLNSQWELALQQKTSASKAGTSATTRSQHFLENRVHAADQFVPHPEEPPLALQLPSGTTATQSTESEDPPVETSSKTPSQADEYFDRRTKQHIYDLLPDTIGIRLQWKDIVECMHGVMDAILHMEKSAERGTVPQRQVYLWQHRH